MPCFSFFFLSAQDCTCCGLDRPVDTPRRRNATWQTRDKELGGFFFFFLRGRTQRLEADVRCLWKVCGEVKELKINVCPEPDALNRQAFPLISSASMQVVGSFSLLLVWFRFTIVKENKKQIFFGWVWSWTLSPAHFNSIFPFLSPILSLEMFLQKIWNVSESFSSHFGSRNF